MEHHSYALHLQSLWRRGRSDLCCVWYTPSLDAAVRCTDIFSVQSWLGSILHWMRPCVALFDLTSSTLQPSYTLHRGTSARHSYQLGLSMRRHRCKSFLVTMTVLSFVTMGVGNRKSLHVFSDDLALSSFYSQYTWLSGTMLYGTAANPR